MNAPFSSTVVSQSFAAKIIEMFECFLRLMLQRARGGHISVYLPTLFPEYFSTHLPPLPSGQSLRRAVVYMVGNSFSLGTALSQPTGTSPSNTTIFTAIVPGVGAQRCTHAQFANQQHQGRIIKRVAARAGDSDGENRLMDG
jgi:hypothetical protein